MGRAGQRNIHVVRVDRRGCLAYECSHGRGYSLTHAHLRTQEGHSSHDRRPVKRRADAHLYTSGLIQVSSSFSPCLQCRPRSSVSAFLPRDVCSSPRLARPHSLYLQPMQKRADRERPPRSLASKASYGARTHDILISYIRGSKSQTIYRLI